MLLISISLLLLVAASSTTIAQNQDSYEGPGFENSLPEQHMLFLKGVEENQYLDRNWTTVTGLPSGSATFSKTSSFTLPTIVDAYAPPVQEPFRFEGNISIILFASLETSSNVCSATNIPVGGPLGASTQFSITLSMGGMEVLSDVETESIVMTKDRTDPHLFLASVNNVNISMNTGDEVRISIQVSHECAVSGTLWWGTYDSRSSIIFEGEIIETEFEVSVDQNRMARIEFTPISPWGVSDFSSQSIELVGPLPWNEMWHGKTVHEDLWLDHFEAPDGFSKGQSNRTILTWTTEKPLDPGNYMIDACITLSDQDPGESCHSWALLRFSVPEDDPPILASIAAAAIVPLGILIWIGASLRGSALPIPAYAAAIVLALSCIATSLNLPDIEDEYYREGGAAPSFMLLSHDPDFGAVSLSELLEGSDVVVVGMFTSGSPNADRQKVDFESARKILPSEGIEASFVQIATGDGLEAYNLDDYSQSLNGSWPILLDDSTVGKSLPSGDSDAVVVIDSAGFIASWEPGSMSPSDIQKASERASYGSGQNPLKLLSMIFGASLLPLTVLALPSERRYEAPEKALIPGVGGFMTLAAAALGFLTWATPVAILSSAGMGQHWILVELALSLVLIYHGTSMVARGRIVEVEAISASFHSRFNPDYREWRGPRRFSEDVYLGLWLAWISWIMEPSMVAQGVGAVARSGLFGLAFSPLVLLAFSISAGSVVLIFRSLVMSFGNYSRILGNLSVGVRPRAWGVAVAVMGSWTLVAIVMGPLTSII